MFLRDTRSLDLDYGSYERVYGDDRGLYRSILKNQMEKDMEMTWKLGLYGGLGELCTVRF